MKIDSQLLEDHQVKVTVEFDAEPFENAKRRAARQIAKRTKIPGFRPGKAPYRIILRHVGEEVIIDRGVEILIKDSYPKIIEQAEIEPNSPGHLKDIASTDPLILEFVIPLAAEVELGDYHAIKIPYEPEEISEQDVNNALQDLRESQAIDEPADRPAQNGDRVFLRLSGNRKQSSILKIEEDHSLEEDLVVIKERNQSIVISSNDDENEWPFPGFSQELIGLRSDDQKTLSHTYTEDSNFESLRGATVEFNLIINEVKTHTLPDIDDEFAQSLDDFKTLEELRERIQENLEHQRKETYDSGYDDRILSELIEQSTLKYPPQMLEEEIKVVMKGLERRLLDQNIDMETYLLTQGMEEENLRSEAEPVAESRLKQSLVLFKIASEEDIQLDKEELETETKRTIDAMSRYMSDSDKRKFTTSDMFTNLADNVEAEMKIDQSLEFLRKIAKGEFDNAESHDRSPQSWRFTCC